MLDVALVFLVKSVNAYLASRTGSSLGEVQPSRIVDDAGKWAIPEDRLGAAIINVEEERVFKSHLPEATLVNGRHVVVEPELKLNLHVLFAANFRQYDQALRYVSYVLMYFQAHPVFTQSDSPGLDERIGKLTLELQSLTYEQLNQVWAFIGGKQLPSVIYKVRMVALQDREPAIGVPVTRIDAEVHGR
ncbi:DUF4255 domain-containing protein [Sorangium sp. So ce260]|uniref:DUF4255 domain-containing protein n=1 Tax=Sorangium sp. So ce260 TaxID=3133291 RepID=UPI003F5E6C95